MPSSLLTTLERSSAQSTSPDQAEIAERRTSMAADRMLMAWVPTSLSLFSFGFTLYRILEGFLESGKTLPGNAYPQRAGGYTGATRCPCVPHGHYGLSVHTQVGISGMAWSDHANAPRKGFGHVLVRAAIGLRYHHPNLVMFPWFSQCRV
jgi:hypothetical protein